MSQSYSEVKTELSDNLDKTRSKRIWWMLFVIPMWVVGCFFVALLLVGALVWLLVTVFNVSFNSLNQTVLNTVIVAIIYTITLVLVVVVPWLVKKYRTTWVDVGLTRLPRWTDILLTPAGLIVYLICSAILIYVASLIFPWFKADQVQDVGFDQISQRYEYILAFVTLVVVAPIAEEIIFRGYMYGKLKKFVPIWVAIVVTSLIFGAIHGAWNLAIDTFALSIILCLLREFTGNIWSSILLHMVKNGIAFYILFINSSLLTTLGG